MEKIHNSKFIIRAPNLGRPWIIILVTAAVFIFSQFVAALVVAIGVRTSNPGASLTDVLHQSAPAQFFYILVAELLAVISVILIVKRINKLGLAAIGLGRWPQWRDISRALLGAGAFYLILIVAGIIITVFAPDIKTDQPQDVGFDILHSPLDYILAFAALAVLPPIGEETLMRGYLYSSLRAHWRFVPAMLLTSLLFGIAHLGSGVGGETLWAAGIDTFLLSIVLVFLREHTGALYAGILLHALNNTIAFTVHF